MEIGLARGVVDEPLHHPHLFPEQCHRKQLPDDQPQAAQSQPARPAPGLAGVYFVHGGDWAGHCAAVVLAFRDQGLAGEGGGEPLEHFKT